MVRHLQSWESPPDHAPMPPTLLAVLLVSSWTAAPSFQELDDPSGLVVSRDGTRLLVVANKVPDVVFRIPVPDALRTATGSALHRLDLDPPSDPLVDGGADDLEGIGLLGDVPVALSEDECRLFGAGRVLVDYSGIEALRERGGRGVEGLALRGLGDGTTLAAVAWEGGEVNGDAEPPLLVLHRLPDALTRSAGVLRITEEHVRPIPLDAAVLGARFSREIVRVPELVWDVRPIDDEGRFRLVVLFHSTERDEHKWLQRIVVKGASATCDGDPLALGDLLDAEDAHAVDWNWEGLAWFDESKRQLALVNDEGARGKRDPPSVLLVTVPAGW